MAGDASGRIHVLPYLGKLRLAEINAATLERFVRHLEAKRTAGRGEGGRSAPPDDDQERPDRPLQDAR